MSDLRLTFAIGDYLHMRELTLGRIKPEGIDLTVLTLPLETIAYRFLAAYEWEVSEFSMATYCTMVANGNARWSGCRCFRPACSGMARSSCGTIRRSKPAPI